MSLEKGMMDIWSLYLYLIIVYSARLTKNSRDSHHIHEIFPQCLITYCNNNMTEVKDGVRQSFKKNLD